MIDTNAPPLWDAATRCFNGPLLAAAIIDRGWTLVQFARACGCTLKKAISDRGGPMSHRSLVLILTTLDTRQPMRTARR